MGQPNQRKDFINWVRKALEGRGTGDQHEPLTMLELAHRPDYRRVDVWKVRSDDNPEALAMAILNTFEGHAKPLGDRQHYSVMKFYGESRDGNHDGETILHHYAPVFETNSGEGGGFSEGPNETGVLAQSMRLTEASHRTSTGAVGKALDSLEHQLDRAMERIDKLVDENERLRVANQAMVNDQFREALILRKVAFKEAQLEKLWGMVIPLAPTLLAGGLRMLTGGKMSMALPGAPTQIEQKIMGFGGSIKPEQYPKIMAALEPAQQILFADLLKDLKAKWEEMQESIKSKGGGAAPPKAPPTATGDGKPTSGVKVSQSSASPSNAPSNAPSNG